MFQNITIVSEDEISIKDTVTDALRDLAPGNDVVAAHDLFMMWMYQAAESSAFLSKSDLAARLQAVGRYLTERSACASEWFTNIVHLNEGPLPYIAKLEEEYRLGTGARFEHILADLDVRRPVLMNNLGAALDSTRFVIVHGASGQGKSTLALRWMHDHVSPIERLQIKAVTSVHHAQTVGLAIASYARITGMKFTVLHDVEPSNRYWTWLLREFASVPGVRLVVTIREDDWRRASSTLPAIPFSETEITFNQHEARVVYEQLTSDAPLPRFLSFDDAWARFGGGPLMEFMYICTQPQSLRQRLAQQISAALEDEGRIPNAITVLRWASIADSFSASLDSGAVADRIQVSELGMLLYRFEKEYLLRQDGSRIRGVHAVRSQLISEIFSEFDGGTDMDRILCEILPLVFEADRAIFLLHAFTRRPASAQRIAEAAMKLGSVTWDGVRGVVESFLWLGAFRKSCNEDFDPAGSWDLAAAFIEECTLPVTPPTSFADWEAIAELSFWSRQTCGRALVPTAWSDSLFTCAKDLDVETLGDLYWGTTFDPPSQAGPILDLIQTTALRKLWVFEVSRISDSVTATYVVTHDLLTASDNSFRINAASVTVCHVLRCLNPEYTVFGARGCGHDWITQIWGYDPAQKDISYNRLPFPRIMEHRKIITRLRRWKRRPSSWPEWCTLAMERRGVICDLFEMVTDTVCRCFGIASRQQRFSSSLKTTAEQLRRALSDRDLDIPELPQCALDEWGYIGDVATDKNQHFLEAHSLALREFMDTREVFRSLLSDACACLCQLRDILDSGFAARGARHRTFALQGLNELNHLLTNAQRTFGLSFGSYAGISLSGLESREIQAYGNLCSVWWLFSYEPQYRGSAPLQHAVSFIENAQRHFFEKLKKRVEKALREVSGSVYGIVTMDGRLVITIDSDASCFDIPELLGPIITDAFPSINGPTENVASIFDRTWKKARVICLRQGILFTSLCWEWGILPLLAGRATAWPSVVSEEDLNRLGISVCPEPFLSAARDLYGASADLRFIFQHLIPLHSDPKAIQLMDENDPDYSDRIIIPYINKCSQCAERVVVEAARVEVSKKLPEKLFAETWDLNWWLEFLRDNMDAQILTIAIDHVAGSVTAR